jgi:hypothetical protein
MGYPPDIVHMNQGWIELIHESPQTLGRRSALEEGADFSPGREAERMSGDSDRVEQISEWARPWTDHMRLPRVPIKRLQQ